MHDTEPTPPADCLGESLIGLGDPPPFEVVNPAGTAAMLLACDHASRAVPGGMNDLGLDNEALQRHIAWDIGAAEVTRSISQKLDAAAVLAGYSRLLIDLNRQPGEPQSIPEISDHTIIPGNRNLADHQRRRRLESLFWPYHNAVSDAVARLWRRGPAPAIFSIHSFTPSLGGKERDWDIGVLWNRDRRMAAPLIDGLNAVGGLRVGDNEPYSGMDIAYTLDLHATAVGLANCAVEIRQDLIETPAGVKYWANLLSDALRDILTMDDLHRVKHF